MRRETWPERLIEEIERHANLPFVYGLSDCYLLAIDCAVAMGIEDPWPAVRGSYKTERGAAGALRKRGWENVADAFSHFFEEIPPVMAKRGDIGIVDDPKGPAGVVFEGTTVVGKAQEFGVRRLPRAMAVRAFRID